MDQSTLASLPEAMAQAVAQFWTTRQMQHDQQRLEGQRDQGLRGAVTGGAQMNGFIRLFRQLILASGIEPHYVFHQRALELPGYFRPTKQWDLVVVRDNQLIIALEAKSHVGPSFGNNFNNRTEEAMGSALDLWTAFREGALKQSRQPFLGYFFLLEDCPGSRIKVRVQEPHFKVFPEFIQTSYIERYAIFCRKLLRERHYTAAALLTSRRDDGLNGLFAEPDADLNIYAFARALVSHAMTFAG